MKIYISNLRVLSTFIVILLHVVAGFVYHFNAINNHTWQIANAIDAFSRFCVPVFVMISGALLLNNKDSIKDFATKRTKRIIYPFLFWSLVYASLATFNSIPSILEIYAALPAIFKLLLTGAEYHLWYIYMIIGLYLLIPILKRWTTSASPQELRYFLCIWAFTLLINSYTKPYLPQVELMYFSKFIGYLLLGFYVDTHISNSTKALRVGVLLLLIGGISTATGTSLLSAANAKFVNTFYEYASLNVALTAIGIFLIFKNSLNRTNNLLQMLDKNSFGIYFIHLIVLGHLKPIFGLWHYANKPWLFAGWAVLLAIAVYLVSFIMIYALGKIKWLKPFIG